MIADIAIDDDEVNEITNYYRLAYNLICDVGRRDIFSFENLKHDEEELFENKSDIDGYELDNHQDAREEIECDRMTRDEL